MSRESPSPDEPVMDARVASRLADVAAERRQAELQTRRRRALAVLVGLGLVAILLGLSLSPVLGAHHVEVAGAGHTPTAQVVAASRLSRSDPLIRIDEEGISRRVRALPWVDRVTVERHWPRTVRLVVVEREPKAVAPCAEGACVVDASGRALAPVMVDGTEVPGAVDPGDVPVVTDVPPAGPPGTVLPDGARPALTVALALPETLSPLVRSVRGTGSGVEIVLDDPTRERNPPIILMGDGSRLGEKLTAATTLLTQLGTAGRIGVDVIDVRVPSSPTLTRTDVRS